MKKRLFGTLEDGTPIEEYTLASDALSVSFITLGGALRTLTTQGRDVIGGYDTLASYVLDDDPYQGAIIGRVANRIANGRFSIDGKEYQLTQNQNGHHLHGGFAGFNRRVWTVKEASDTHAVLTLFSPDGEEGYPANLQTEVTYTVSGDCLRIDFRAEGDGATPVNLTSHGFFNLGGLDSGSIMEHTAHIRADRYTEVENLIPTGNRPSVVGTPLDFRSPKRLCEGLTENFTTYDHNLLFAPDAPKREVAGILLPHVATFSFRGLAMEVYTTSPGAQLYTGAYLGGALTFKGGIPKRKHHAFCFEPQLEPDGIHHGTPPLSAGEVFKATAVYRFTAQ